MITHTPAPVPVAAPRGSVQKTFVAARILSGFTSDDHFQQLAGEYLGKLDAAGRARVLAEAQASRAFVAQLPPSVPSDIFVREITGSHVDAIKVDRLFQQSFGQRPHKFCYVRPTGIVALQAWIEPRSDPVPTTEEELLEFALPRRWDTPAEISFIPPRGPIQILSSRPGLQGVDIEMDAATSRVFLSAPKHVNLVQLKHFQNRYFLVNGYHRVADAIAARVAEFPALVVETFDPKDVALMGAGTFNFGYVLNRARPPFVEDFHTAAAITAEVRERRYGVSVSLEVRPINIAI